MSEYQIKEGYNPSVYEVIDKESRRRVGSLKVEKKMDSDYVNFVEHFYHKDVIKFVCDNFSPMNNWQKYILLKVCDYMDESDILHPINDADIHNHFDLVDKPINSYYNYLIKLTRIFKYDVDPQLFDREEFEELLTYYARLGCISAEGKLIALPVLRRQDNKYENRMSLDYRSIISSFSGVQENCSKFEAVVRYFPELTIDQVPSLIRTRSFTSTDEVDNYFYEKLSSTYKRKLISAEIKDSNMIHLAIRREPVNSLSTIIKLTQTYDRYIFPISVIRSWPERLLLAASIYWNTAAYITKEQALKVLDRPGLPTAFVDSILNIHTEPNILDKVIATKLLSPRCIRHSMTDSVKRSFKLKLVALKDDPDKGLNLYRNLLETIEEGDHGYEPIL